MPLSDPMRLGGFAYLLKPMLDEKAPLISIVLQPETNIDREVNHVVTLCD